MRGKPKEMRGFTPTSRSGQAMTTHTPGPHDRITHKLKDGSLFAARQEIEQLKALNADLLEALKDALVWIEYQRKGELLVILKEAADWIESTSEDGAEVFAANIRAAIAKAEGTQS